MARLQVSHVAASGHGVHACEVDVCSYDDGIIDEVDKDSFIKSFFLNITPESICCTVQRFISVSPLRRIISNEETVSAIKHRYVKNENENENENENSDNHKFKLHQSKAGGLTLLFDGKPIQAQEITMRATPNDLICVDIKGIYLQELDIDIDGLN